MSRKLVMFLIILMIGVALDQITKQLIVQALPVNSHVVIGQGFFNLVHIYNRGAAFGLLSNMSPWLAKWFFVFTTGLVLLVVSYLWWRLPEGHWGPSLGYTLIMTGAVGNFIDRLRLGEVIDFLDFYWGHYHWPAFNVADSLVCLGAGVLIWEILREGKRPDASHPA